MEKIVEFCILFVLRAEKCNQISKCILFVLCAEKCNQISNLGCYFIKFRMLFPAVLMNIPDSNVCLKGASSIMK